MSAKCFKSAEALADYQADREVQEALRVAAMPPAEHFLWFKENWGRLQDNASVIFAGVERKGGDARCYTSMEEKNRFDEAREIERALQIQAR
jgi:hypothetical protein